MGDHFGTIFDRTIRKFDLKARAIAREADLSASALSAFRTGKKNLSTQSLKTLLDAMERLAPGSRAHFHSLAAGEPLQDYTTIEDVVNSLPPEELPKLLNAIADRIQAPTLAAFSSDGHPELAAAS